MKRRERKPTVMTVPWFVQATKGLRVQTSSRPSSSIPAIRLINTVAYTGTVIPGIEMSNKPTLSLSQPHSDVPITMFMTVVVTLKTLPRNLFFNNLI